MAPGAGRGQHDKGSGVTGALMAPFSPQECAPAVQGFVDDTRQDRCHAGATRTAAARLDGRWTIPASMAYLVAFSTSRLLLKLDTLPTSDRRA
jgi:hypothetical protein